MERICWRGPQDMHNLIHSWYLKNDANPDEIRGESHVVHLKLSDSKAKNERRQRARAIMLKKAWLKK